MRLATQQYFAANSRRGSTGLAWEHRQRPRRASCQLHRSCRELHLQHTAGLCKSPTNFVDPTGTKDVLGDPATASGTVVVIHDDAFGNPDYLVDLVNTARNHGLAVIEYSMPDDTQKFVNDATPKNIVGVIMIGHATGDQIADVTSTLLNDKLKGFDLKFLFVRGCHSRDYFNSLNSARLGSRQKPFGKNTLTVSNYGYITPFSDDSDVVLLEGFLNGTKTPQDSAIHHNLFFDILGELRARTIGFGE